MPFFFEFEDITFGASAEVTEKIITSTEAEKKHIVAIKASPHYEGRDYDLLAFIERDKIVDVPLKTLVKDGIEQTDKEYPLEWVEIDQELPVGSSLAVGFRFDATDEGDHHVTVKYRLV